MKTLYKIALFAVLLLSAAPVFAQTEEREKGIELYNKGEYQKSAELLQKAIEANKEDEKSWLYLGMSQARLKNMQQAVKAFKEADKISTKKKESVPTQPGVKIISKPRALYTEEARVNNIQGEIKVAVEFGADGSIKAIVPFQTLPYGLTENVLQAIRGVKFTPALKNDNPYSTIGILSYRFTIY